MLPEIKRYVKSAVRTTGYTLVPNEQVPALESTVRSCVQSESPVILDIGGHKGESIDRFKKWYPNSTVHSFEPCPSTFTEMQIAFGSVSGVTLLPLAVTDKIGEAELEINAQSATNSLLHLDDNASEQWGQNLKFSGERSTVKTTTIDEYCRSKNIGHVDICKIDVQGAEHAVLRGARGLLSRAAIKMVICEIIVAETYVGQVPLSWYFKFFEDYNLKLVDFVDLHRSGKKLMQLDVLLVSKAHYEAIST